MDLNVKAAPVAVSQRSIELKMQRNTLSQELSTLNTQLRETTGLIDSLEHRVHAATDLLRLKTTGVGRLDHLECPTCHRDFDLTLFGLTSHRKDWSALEDDFGTFLFMTNASEAIFAQFTA